MVECISIYLYAWGMPHAVKNKTNILVCVTCLIFCASHNCLLVIPGGRVPSLKSFSSCTLASSCAPEVNSVRGSITSRKCFNLPRNVLWKKTNKQVQKNRKEKNPDAFFWVDFWRLNHPTDRKTRRTRRTKTRTRMWLLNWNKRSSIKAVRLKLLPNKGDNKINED